MQKRTYRRRRYLVRREFQLKYVGLIQAVMFISAIIVGYTIYYNSWILLGEKLAAVYPQGRLVHIFKTVNIRLAVNLAFVSLFWIGIGILASHKIAGPVYRMIHFLESVAKGDCSQRLRLRKKDELHDLADAINSVVDRLETEKKT